MGSIFVAWHDFSQWTYTVRLDFSLRSKTLQGSGWICRHWLRVATWLAFGYGSHKTDGQIILMVNPH